METGLVCPTFCLLQRELEKRLRRWHQQILVLATSQRVRMRDTRTWLQGASNRLFSNLYRTESDGARSGTGSNRKKQI